MRIKTVNCPEAKKHHKTIWLQVLETDEFDARTYDAILDYLMTKRTSVIEDLNTYDNLQSQACHQSWNGPSVWRNDHHTDRDISN